MKHIIFVSIFIIFSLITETSIANTPFSKNQAVILLNRVEEGEVFGSLEKLLPDESTTDIQLVGQLRRIPLNNTHGFYLFQIAWTGLQHQQQQTKQMAFEKPLVSTFKGKKSFLKKGQSLPIEGNSEDLLRSLQQLNSGSIDKEDLKKKRVAENPRSEGRFVEVEPFKSNPLPISSAEKKPSKQKTGKQENLEPAADGSHTISNSAISATTSSNGILANAGTSSPIPLTNTSPSPHFNTSLSLLPPLTTGNVTNGMTRVNEPSRVDRLLELPEPSETPPEPEAPEITYAVTQEGCQPTIDRHHERVVIQNRTRKFENGVMVEEGGCEESLEMYPIFKDFLCNDCKNDEVNVPEKKAYSRFKEYWLNKEFQRKDLSETIYTDFTRPYVFRDETGGCLPLLDLEHNTAYRQVETVYYNRHNARQVVSICHPAPDQSPVPIFETADRCSYAHDFINNRSYEQKRSIFKLDEIEREVLSCRPVGAPLPHEFVRTGCRPLVNAADGTFIDMVRRKIRTPMGAKIITDECEPAQNNALQATREGCKGEYFHDFSGGRSYIKKRYFYPHASGGEYVTACLRTDEFLPHQTRINGYEHDDQHRISKPKFEIFIASLEQGSLVIDPAQVRGTMGQTNYTFVRNEQKQTTSQYYEGCYRRTRTQSFDIYTRADGSTYEHLIGPGAPIAWPVDECTRTPEYQYYQVVDRKGNFWRHATHRTLTRTRTRITYPNGHVEYTGWSGWY